MLSARPMSSSGGMVQGSTEGTVEKADYKMEIDKSLFDE